MKPTFLICSERSGSNLIRAMMDAHSQVYAPIPLNLGRDFWYHVFRYGDLARDENWAALVKDVAGRFAGSAAELGFSITETELADGVTDRSFAALYRHIHRRGMQEAGKSRLFLKENHVGQYLSLYLEAFPDATFVYQVRDPRDYLLSCRRVAGIDPLYRSDTACIHVWRQDQESALNARFTLGPDRVFVQRYEDLVRQPERVLEPLCEFLQLPFEDGMTRYHTRKESKQAAGKLPGFWQNLSRPVMRDNTEKYRTGLGRLAIASVEQRVGHLMGQLGYPTVSTPGPATAPAVVRAYETYRRVRALMPTPRVERGGGQSPAPGPPPAVLAAPLNQVSFAYAEVERTAPTVA